MTLIRNDTPVKSADGVQIAILEDHQNVALELADWSPLDGRAAITVFNDHLANADEFLERLLPFAARRLRSRRPVYINRWRDDSACVKRA